MNPALRLESELIVADQRRIHGAVAELDRRIDLLLRQVEGNDAKPSAQPPAQEPDRVEATPPSLPPRIFPHATISAGSEPTPDLKPQNAPPPLLREPVSTVHTPGEGTPEYAAEPASAGTASTSESLELRLGTYWMSRIGMLILLTGLVFLGNYAYHRVMGLLGPGGKLTLMTLAGLGLIGAGAWLEQSRETMRNFGRVLLGGGAATIYYTAYAAHFVQPLRVIENPLGAGCLLLFVAGGIAWFAERRRQESIAVIAILLSYYTSAINPVGAFTLWSNLLLTAVATCFLVKHRWSRITAVSLFATYGSYGYWRLHQLAESVPSSGPVACLAFLAIYWLLFTIAVFAVDAEVWRNGKRTAFLTLNNLALFTYGALHFSRYRPSEFWVFAAGFGVVLLGLAAVSARRHRDLPSLDGAYLAQGLLLITLGFVLRLTGPQLAIVLAVQSGALIACARLRQGLIYQIGAALSGLAAFAIALVQLLSSRVDPLAFGLAVAGLLLLCSIAAKAPWRKEAGSVFSVTSLCYAALALTVGGVVILKASPSAWEAPVFALVAVGLPAIAQRRFPEIGFPAQAFALIAVALVVDAPASAGWSPLLVAGACLALMHGWQLTRAVNATLAGWVQLLFAVLAAATLFVWMNSRFTGETWLLAASGIAVGSVLYGLLTRAWATAAAGQLFTGGTVVAFVIPGLLERSNWLVGLAPAANCAVTGGLLVLLGAHRWPTFASAAVYRAIATAYRAVAAMLFAAWIFRFVPSAHWAWLFLMLGAALLGAGGLTASNFRWGVGASYAAVGLALSWIAPGPPASLLHLVGIVAIPVAFRLHRGSGADSSQLSWISRLFEGSSIVALWLWVTRAVVFYHWQSQLTIAWAITGVLVLSVGLASREGFYRIAGLLLISLSVGRLFFIDVWQFDTLYRILTFVILGALLLILSFVYHRLAENLRRWL